MIFSGPRNHSNHSLIFSGPRNHSNHSFHSNHAVGTVSNNRHSLSSPQKALKCVGVLQAPGILERRARQSGRIQNRSGGRLNPLALSRFLRRGMAPACKNRSAAPLTARLFLPQAAPRRSCPEKALCNSSNALLHAFSASRLERLLLLGPGGAALSASCPLALSRFSQAGLGPLCENRSAAPAASSLPRPQDALDAAALVVEGG